MVSNALEVEIGKVWDAGYREGYRVAICEINGLKDKMAAIILAIETKKETQSC